jgi:manganese/zinc/iron transport system ATP- binding protein
MNAMPAREALRFENLTVAYRQLPVLWGIEAAIPAGSLTGIIGPNGSGKSTLLKACAGLLEPLSGSVQYFGSKSLDEVRGQVCYMPQRESVDWEFPITALDVVLMGSYRRVGFFRRPSKAEREAALQCLHRVGLAAFAGRRIAELSGGQQQRVFLARALLTRAEIYLLDEPFSAVDARTEEILLETLKGLVREGKTVVVVLHDLQAVTAHTDFVLLLNTRLVKFDRTELVMSRENIERTFGGQLQGLAAVLDLVGRKGV